MVTNISSQQKTYANPIHMPNETVAALLNDKVSTFICQGSPLKCVSLERYVENCYKYCHRSAFVEFKQKFSTEQQPHPKKNLFNCFFGYS